MTQFKLPAVGIVMLTTMKFVYAKKLANNIVTSYT